MSLNGQVIAQLIAARVLVVVLSYRSSKNVLKALRADLLRELDAVEDCTVKSKWLRKQLADCRKTV